jgi:hypothetical protein
MSKRLFLILSAMIATGVQAAPLETGYLFEGYAIGSYHSVRDSTLNPANRILQIPTYQLGLDLRPQAAADWGTLSALARPRIRGFAQSGDNLTEETFARFHFDEASLKWKATEDFQLLGGIHYVQWGPAELFSPSNPLIHFSLDQRSIIFRMRGKALIKADYYFSQKSFLTAIVEPVSNGEADWITGYKFVPRGLLRWEQQLGDHPGNYFGLSVGRMERENLFAAGYAAYYFDDYWSTYADVRVSPGSPALYPSVTSPTGFEPGQTNAGQWYSLSTLGIRWEGFFDTRLEYILNTYGLSPREWDSGLSLATTNPGASAALFRAGLEMPRQQYLYTSLRTDRLGTGDELRLSVRYLHSLGDHSGAFFSAVEWNFNPLCTLIVEPMVTHGGAKGEFSQAASMEIFTELRVAL